MAASSHLVLARKWRPERFNDLVGQEHVTRTLVQALTSGRIAHAFLFTGIRGVGKTTAARILARCLECAQGPTAEPCGECAACREIRAGTALDVVEIDGATYRKIDDARAIIENLGYRPARDRFKVYIIDEAHQLTDQAFNALLKTLEEPPAHVKFILATTEPQKMPETILSRLQRYDFRRIPFAVVRTRLRELAEREGAEIEDNALTLLAREASGSMRDAERMLETAIASLDGRIGEGELAAILGVASRTRIFEIIGAILDKDPASALRAVRELHQRGANLESLGRDLLEMMRNLAVASLPSAEGPNLLLAELPDQEAAELQRLAPKASTRDLMRLFRLMADAQEQLARSSYPDLMLEMAMIRMATLAPVLDADELMRAIGAAGSGSASEDPGNRAASRPLPGIQPPSTGKGRSPAQESAPGSSASMIEVQSLTPVESNSAPMRRIPFKGEIRADAPRRVTPAAMPASESPPDPGAGGDLPDLRDFIRGRRAALAGFMEQGASLKMDGDLLTVIPRNDIYVRYLNDNRHVIGELASELYGRRIKVEMAAAGATKMPSSNPPELPDSPVEESSQSQPMPAAAPNVEGVAEGDAGAPGPETAAGAPGEQAQPDARQKLYADPLVRRIFEEFDARLVELKTTSTRPDASAPAVSKK
jgi:DNA polymerase III subunit gamma/tau